MTGKRILELDGLRGIAVLMVLLWHFSGDLISSSSPIKSVVYSVTVFGRTGVDLFFVLSGFLIIGILVDNRGKESLFKTFYIRRAMRIYPPYFLLIALYWLSYAAFGETASFNSDGGVLLQLLAQVTFTWNVLMAWTGDGVANGFSVAWSVNIEEWFYIVFPVILVTIKPKYLLKFLALTALLSALSRAIFSLKYPQFGLAPYVLMPLRLDGLCIGGMVAIGMRSPQFWSFMERWKSAVVFCALGFAITLPFVIAAAVPKLMLHMYLWGHFYLSLGFATVLIATLLLVDAGNVRLLRSRFLREFGRYSYSLYLFHPLFLSVGFLLVGKEARVDSWATMVLALVTFATCYVFCRSLYHLIERPSVRFGHTFEYGVAKQRRTALT